MSETACGLTTDIGAAGACEIFCQVVLGGGATITLRVEETIRRALSAVNLQVAQSEACHFRTIVVRPKLRKTAGRL